MSLQSRSTIIATLAGAALGGIFGAVAKLRRGKPLHPRGVVFDAVLRRTGSPVAWGVDWLDAPGEDHGLVRLSRAVGLPAPIPDILGLAFTFTGPDGDRHDLLLATTGLAPGARFLLMPTLHPERSSYSSLFPYQTPRGPVLLAATPVSAAEQRGQALSFRLLAAGLVGPWREFATMDLTERPDGAADEPLRLDPVLHVMPGLSWAQPLARLREPAYAAARRTPPRRPSHAVAAESVRLR
jgi:hypothetical protein